MRARLLFLLALLLISSVLAARGGGGCFLSGTLVQTSEGGRPIEQLHIGDTVLAFGPDSRLAPVQVEQLYSVQRDSYYQIKAANLTLSVTAEHPMYVGNDSFVEVQDLHAGDIIYLDENGVLAPASISSISPIYTPTFVYNLRVGGAHTFIANSFAVHNKGGGGGGCFEASTLIRTPQGSKPISAIQIGDEVLAPSEDGTLQPSVVSNTYSLMSDEHFVLSTSSSRLEVTGTHPFLTPDGWVMAQDLHTGDLLYHYGADGKPVPEPLLAKLLVSRPLQVYNLEVAGPHTFLADGIEVHNKGGSSHSSSSHSSSHSSSSHYSSSDNVFYYDCNQTDGEGANKSACCDLTSSVYKSNGSLITSSAFPYCTCSMSGNNSLSSSVMVGSACNCSNSQAFFSPSRPPDCPFSFGTIFSSLSTDIASGDVCCFVPIIIILVIVFATFGLSKFSSISEWSSTIQSPKQAIQAKAGQVSALLKAWGAADPVWDMASIQTRAQSTFLKLQECWTKREYSPMQSLLTPALFAQHTAQLEAMAGRHEFNKMENVQILDMQIIQASRFNDSNEDRFIMWFQVKAKDTIVDDRTGAQIRGDEGTGQFEEFWTFSRSGNNWLLSEITQPEEGQRLIAQKNFDETVTDRQTREIEARSKGGAATPQVSPVREQAESGDISSIASQASKTSKLLSFLANTSPFWKEEDLLTTARTLYIQLNTAMEANKPEKVRASLSDPLFSSLAEASAQLAANGHRIEKRNLTVRDVQIVLVHNYDDLLKNEFTAWISGQAQTVVADAKSGTIMSGDDEVRDFDEYWTFARKVDGWVLVDMQAGLKAGDFIGQKNVDASVSPSMLEWYYKQERAV